MLKKYVRNLVGILLLVLLVSQPLSAVTLSEKETVRIENALEKSKESLIQQKIVIEQLSTELKKQSESYRKLERKLERDKIKSNVIVGVTCFIFGAVAGGVAYGVYVYPWLSSD